MRLFKGRDSDGVRGIKLEEGDEVISMAILRHVEATPGERAAYLKQALACAAPRARRSRKARRRPTARARRATEGGRADAASATPSSARKEQFVLTVSEKGFGKRTSSYEYRTSGRGGKGIVAMVVNERNGRWSPRSPWRTATRSCW